jgi:protease I
VADVVMVIAPEVFRDEEYAEPVRILEQHGARVTTASAAPGKCIGKLGLVAHADLSLAEAMHRSWDAVVFVGGSGAQRFFDDTEAHTLARQAARAGAVVGAICIAPSVLAHAGLLAGVTATAFPSQKGDLLRHGATWTEGPVAVDGRIITANGPEAATEFGMQLAEALGLS